MSAPDLPRGRCQMILLMIHDFSLSLKLLWRPLDLPHFLSGHSVSGMVNFTESFDLDETPQPQPLQKPISSGTSCDSWRFGHAMQMLFLSS